MFRDSIHIGNNKNTGAYYTRHWRKMLNDIFEFTCVWKVYRNHLHTSCCPICERTHSTLISWQKVYKLNLRRWRRARKKSTEILRKSHFSCPVFIVKKLSVQFMCLYFILLLLSSSSLLLWQRLLSSVWLKIHKWTKTIQKKKTEKKDIHLDAMSTEFMSTSSSFSSHCDRQANVFLYLLCIEKVNFGPLVGLIVLKLLRLFDIVSIERFLQRNSIPFKLCMPCRW